MWGAVSISIYTLRGDLGTTFSILPVGRKPLIPPGINIKLSRQIWDTIQIASNTGSYVFLQKKIIKYFLTTSQFGVVNVQQTCASRREKKRTLFWRLIRGLVWYGTGWMERCTLCRWHWTMKSIVWATREGGGCATPTIPSPPNASDSFWLLYFLVIIVHTYEKQPNAKAERMRISE